LMCPKAKFNKHLNLIRMIIKDICNIFVSIVVYANHEL
jgi:hypothetical protein